MVVGRTAAAPCPLVFLQHSNAAALRGMRERGGKWGREEDREGEKGEGKERKRRGEVESERKQVGGRKEG